MESTNALHIVIQFFFDLTGISRDQYRRIVKLEEDLQWVCVQCVDSTSTHPKEVYLHLSYVICTIIFKTLKNIKIITVLLNFLNFSLLPQLMPQQLIPLKTMNRKMNLWYDISTIDSEEHFFMFSDMCQCLKSFFLLISAPGCTRCHIPCVFGHH